jgi:DivIVA domain-containing protein
MIDERFNLTPVDVRTQEFGRKLNGYDPVRVEEFRTRVAEELERLIKLNHELDGKHKAAIEQLRAFRDRDKALNDALVSAQQLRAEIREQAEREAQLVIREARAEGERLIDASRSGVRQVETELAMLEKTRRAFISQMRALAERHLHELEAMEATSAPPTRQRPAEEAAPPAAAPQQPPANTAQQQTPAWLNAVVNKDE